MHTLQGKTCKCSYSKDRKYFISDKLPSNVKFSFEIFNLIVSNIKNNGGRMLKGNGRNSKLGEGKCTYDTLAGVIGRDYFGKQTGESILDPLFVLAAVLDWAGICNNERGYLSLK